MMIFSATHHNKHVAMHKSIMPLWSLKLGVKLLGRPTGVSDELKSAYLIWAVFLSTYQSVPVMPCKKVCLAILFLGIKLSGSIKLPCRRVHIKTLGSLP